MLENPFRPSEIAAHELAQFAKSSGISQQWVGIEPPFIRQALLLDRAKC